MRAISTPRTRCRSVAASRNGRPIYVISNQIRAPRRAAALRAGARRRAEVAPARRGPRRLRLRPRQPRRPQPARGGRAPASTRRRRPGNQRYMPSRGLPEVRAGDLRLVRAPYGVTLRSRERGGGHHRLEGGHRAPAAGARRARRLRAGARSRLSDPPLRRRHRRRRAGAGRDRPGTRCLRRDRGGARARAAHAQGADRQLPAQPHQRRRRSRRSYEKVVALAQREKLWVISDLAYADLLLRRPARAQHLPGAGRARRGGRVLHRLEELLDARLAGRLLRRQPRPGGRRWPPSRATSTTASSRPAQLAAATALARCDADVAANRELYRHRAACCATALRGGGLAGAAARGDDVRLGAAARQRARTLGSVGFASELLREGRRGGGARASASAPAARVTSASR